MDKDGVIKIRKILKEQWREHHLGGYKVLRLGSNCTCHLCLIDKLVDEAMKSDEKYY